MTEQRKRPSDPTPQADTGREPGTAQVIPMHTQDNAETPQEDYLAHIVTGAAIAGMPPTEWLLKQRIPMRGLVAIYAPPKSGKSVVATELAVSAALGEAFWQAQFSKAMTVLYIAAERIEDIADRLKATLQARGVPYPDTLHLYARNAGPLQIGSTAHRAGLVQVVQHLKPDLIIFDTFARMTLGIEENSSAEMGEAVEQFNELLRAAGPQCAGILVHHAGKDKTKGLRGSTAMLGALDAVWSVEKVSNEGAYRLSVEAMNAGATPPPEHFTIVGEVIEGREDSTPVLKWQAFADYANARDKWLAETIAAAGVKGLSKQEVTDLYNEHHGASKASATVYGWLKALMTKGEIEQSAGSKSATRYYGKGLAPK